jgi:hypothetical protein
MNTPQNRPPEKIGEPESSRPIALPIVSTPVPHPHLSPAARMPVRARKVGTATESLAVIESAPEGHPVGTGTRVGRRRLLQLRDELQDRDWAILRSVAAHRFLLTRHIEILHVVAERGSTVSTGRATRRILGRLASFGLLRHLKRRVGGVRAGSASYVWMLGPVGDRLLRIDERDRRRRMHEPSLRLLHHALAIAELHVLLVVAHRDGRLELLQVELEPESWRSYLGRGGERLQVRPDLVVVTGAGEFEDHWFIEVDLMTEHTPTIVRKSRQYIEYQQTGQEQERLGLFPRIVWATPDEGRATDIDAALSAAKLDRQLFRVCRLEDIVTALQLGGAA